MGSMQRLEIATEVLANVDNPTDVTPTEINRWINHAYSHMTHPAVHEFEDLRVSFDITLIAGQASYDLGVLQPDYRILAIRNFSYYAAASANIDLTTTVRHKLKPKSIEWYESTIHPKIDRPHNYTIGEGQTVLFSNTPNNTNTVRAKVFREAAKLALDTDTTIAPEYFDEVLITGAQAFTEFKLGMRDKANETFQLYNNLINGGADKELLEVQNWGVQTTLVSTPIMGVST